MSPRSSSRHNPSRQRSDRAVSKGERRWRLSRFSLVPALLALIGMLAFAYPTAASWVSQYNQSKVVADYSSEVDNAVPDAAPQSAHAHDHNAALPVGALLPPHTPVPTRAGTPRGTAPDHNAILTANPPRLMSRLRLPSPPPHLPVHPRPSR